MQNLPNHSVMSGEDQVSPQDSKYSCVDQQGIFIRYKDGARATE